MNNNKPLILSPAGDRLSFLAAIAAGADAVYCGLKNFSARMQANNFSVSELAELTDFAHKKNVKVYITLNSLLKPDEIKNAGNLIIKLYKFVKPDALIIQDIGFIKIAEDAGFPLNKIHLSTLANVSFPLGLKAAQKLGAGAVVLPREFTIDEIKAVAKICDKNLNLEVFIHGALCYSISGRCYWSSYLGGKSGLRGWCVQPCRRIYEYKGQKRKFFSCEDFSIDVLAKLLLKIPEIKAWKIEGRKKGPHYVYYTTTAYKMLRDAPNDSSIKKEATNLLKNALNRKTTHYNFLPQRRFNPVDTKEYTASGLLIGKIKGGKKNPYLIPNDELFEKDILRIGFEDEKRHKIIKIRKYIPKRGKFYIQTSSKNIDYSDAPVFLMDRREKELENMIEALEKEIKPLNIDIKNVKFEEKNFAPLKKISFSKEIYLYKGLPSKKPIGITACMLDFESAKKAVKKNASNTWWWLPPAIFPDDEKNILIAIDLLLKKKAKTFVLNALWQRAFFDNKKVKLIAGPFCNIANQYAVFKAKEIGFEGVIVSPELCEKDYIKLAKKSPLPLGIVISGSFPLGISRILSDDLKLNAPFISPKNETAFVKKYGSCFFIYPNWALDLSSKKNVLQKAGFSFFVHMMELFERDIKMKQRKSLWNWKLGLK
jgi:U32 family peptidase